MFNINPALVISLFPADTISGRLHVPRDGWMALFGAVDGAVLEAKQINHPETSKGPLSRVSHVTKRGSVDSLKGSTKGSDKDVAPPAANESESRSTIKADVLQSCLVQHSKH